MSEFKSTEKCCDCFEKMLHAFQWFKPEGEYGVLLMPYIPDLYEPTKWRVNFCPSCGKDIRGIVITDD